MEDTNKVLMKGRPKMALNPTGVTWMQFLTSTVLKVLIKLLRGKRGGLPAVLR
jgi:hypothetical protein